MVVQRSSSTKDPEYCTALPRTSSRIWIDQREKMDHPEAVEVGFEGGGIEF